MMHSDEHITSLPLDGRLRGAWGAVKGHSIVKLRDRSHLTTKVLCRQKWVPWLPMLLFTLGDKKLFCCREGVQNLFGQRQKYA